MGCDVAWAVRTRGVTTAKNATWGVSRGLMDLGNTPQPTPNCPGVHFAVFGPFPVLFQKRASGGRSPGRFYRSALRDCCSRARPQLRRGLSGSRAVRPHESPTALQGRRCEPPRRRRRSRRSGRAAQPHARRRAALVVLSGASSLCAHARRPLRSPSMAASPKPPALGGRRRGAPTFRAAGGSLAARPGRQGAQPRRQGPRKRSAVVVFWSHS